MDEPVKKRILMADDDIPWSRAFSLKLENAGFSVTVAHDGQQALDALEKEKFDLILLDLIMPIMSGFDVLAELRTRGNTTPVYVSSSLNQADDRQRALDLGATGFMVKQDTAIASLIETVKKALEV